MDKRAPITVKFEIPYFTVSGIQVRYLKIVEKSGYQALPWVRYITQNGDDYRCGAFGLIQRWSVHSALSVCGQHWRKATLLQCQCRFYPVFWFHHECFLNSNCAWSDMYWSRDMILSYCVIELVCWSFDASTRNPFNRSEVKVFGRKYASMWSNMRNDSCFRTNDLSKLHFASTNVLHRRRCSSTFLGFDARKKRLILLKTATKEQSFCFGCFNTRAQACTLENPRQNLADSFSDSAL